VRLAASLCGALCAAAMAVPSTTARSAAAPGVLGSYRARLFKSRAEGPVQGVECDLPILDEGSGHSLRRFPLAFGQGPSIALVRFGRFADWQTVGASVEVFQFQVCRQKFHFLKSLSFPAVHRPSGQRPSLRPLRPVGNAELYRSGVSVESRESAPMVAIALEAWIYDNVT
jgi:hypothetical protein